MLHSKNFYYQKWQCFYYCGLYDFNFLLDYLFIIVLLIVKILNESDDEFLDGNNHLNSISLTQCVGMWKFFLQVMNAVKLWEFEFSLLWRKDGNKIMFNSDVNCNEWMIKFFYQIWHLSYISDIGSMISLFLW